MNGPIFYGAPAPPSRGLVMLKLGTGSCSPWLTFLKLKLFCLFEDIVHVGVKFVVVDDDVAVLN